MIVTCHIQWTAISLKGPHSISFTMIRAVFLITLYLVTTRNRQQVNTQMTPMTDNVCLYSLWVPEGYAGERCQCGLARRTENDGGTSTLRGKVEILEDQNTAMMQQVAALMQQVAAMADMDKLNRQQIATLLQLNTDCNSQSTAPSQTIHNEGASENINRTVTSSGGVHYIRWGRTTCPSQAKIRYKGYAGGSHSTHSGGGSDYLCLPEEPQWDRHMDGFQGNQLFSVEYKLEGAGTPFSNANNGGQSLTNNNAPCVVCHVTSRSNKIMIPARIDCPVGWTREYQGYLVSSHNSQKRNSYVCLDEAPEALPGSMASINGALFYVVEASCGYLPCSIYKDTWEVTCVVCTL